jgi:hypothetical protein
VIHEPTCTGTKRCTKCGETKPALAFPARPENSDGMHSWCRECCNADDARRRRRNQQFGARKTVRARVRHMAGSPNDVYGEDD